MVFDMFNEKIFINDEVKFMIGQDQYTGTVNFISPSGLLRINALVGEYRRMPNNVIKVMRCTDTSENEFRIVKAARLNN